MKNFILLVFFSVLFMFTLSAQTTVDDGGLIITVKDLKKASALNQNLTSIDKRNKKVIVKLGFKNKTKDLIDINAISLVDTISKKRYRAIDVAVGNPISYSDGILLKNRDVRINTTSTRIFYKPEHKDTFLDYSISDYQDIEYKTRTNRRDKKGVQLYFKPLHRKIKRVKIYFSVPKNKTDFDVYYKNQKLTNAVFK